MANPGGHQPFRLSTHSVNGYEVDEYEWNLGSGTRAIPRWIYHLDLTSRVNLALVTAFQNRPLRVAAPGFDSSRPALGLEYDNAWYYTLHALSSGGNDAARLLENISAASGTVGWLAMGDFNRDPRDLTVPDGSEIVATGHATHERGGELDYMVTKLPRGTTGFEARLGANSGSDHFPVEFSAL